jgi:hypothetical protein
MGGSWEAHVRLMEAHGRPMGSLWDDLARSDRSLNGVIRQGKKRGLGGAHRGGIWAEDKGHVQPELLRRCKVGWCCGSVTFTIQ